MKTILISYDLKAPGKDYKNLWEHLRSYGTWSKPLESVWLIKTNLSAEQVRDAALYHIDANDKIFVVEVTSVAAWKNLTQEVSNWIKSNL